MGVIALHIHIHTYNVLYLTLVSLKSFQVYNRHDKSGHDKSGDIYKRLIHICIYECTHPHTHMHNVHVCKYTG